jgi:hypothetical protein
MGGVAPIIVVLRTAEPADRAPNATAELLECQAKRPFRVVKMSVVARVEATPTFPIYIELQHIYLSIDDILTDASIAGAFL